MAFREGPLLLKRSANDLEDSRFGFVVPVKTAKKAVLRNRIRRRISEITRLRLPGIKKGFDVLISAFPGADKLSFPELKGALERLFQKSKLYVPKNIFESD